MMTCPKCKLVNPDNTVVCDCGYNFDTGKANPSMTYIERLRVAWLLMWRGTLIGGGIGFLWGFLLALFFGRSPAVNMIAFWGAIPLGLFIGSPYVIAMMIRKRFKGFHLEIVRDGNLEAVTGP